MGRTIQNRYPGEKALDHVFSRLSVTPAIKDDGHNRLSTDALERRFHVVPNESVHANTEMKLL